MRCWRTIDLEKKYGFHKIALISTLVMMLVFSIMFASLQTFFSQTLHDRYFIVFTVSLILLYPAHKFLHILPYIRFMHKLTFKCQIKLMVLPVIIVRVKEPISKMRFVISLLNPFIILNSLFIIGCAIFPHYIHYFTMLFAFHTGICAIDFINLKSLIASPKSSYIEENDDGYEILISQ
ncbi:membrane-associated HD superfamily phosphohydrolase [Oikeobacillus pervagus]|uniref:Membrane-associated HD superfamily phosphohydrolase n=1 Tax=Oikeobacillus pervagus TaxID=1325931 RepID=A0AAJ1WIW3_9BACI|nr:DUF3267 domain-containing protein [Oikeobacillus pervagus]MDQ0214753.1 membrane-associated HD superfamily phosphohydrolase [Oikeobacillus pervagus]